MNTSILFLTFNRKEKSIKVLKEILKINPKKIYVSSDGGRTLEEKKIVEEIRHQIENMIPLSCEIVRFYNKENLGCKNAVANAITNFFEFEEQGIILEDDCLPSKQFFNFCELYLEEYKNDPKLFHISGTNLLSESESSYFSKYPAVWGWATWKNKWELYNRNLENIESFNEISSLLKRPYEFQYWKSIFSLSKRNKIDTWDYQWIFTIWKHGGYALTPSHNYILNIGFDEEATHTKTNIITQKLYSREVILEESIYKSNILDEKVFNLYHVNDSLTTKLLLLIKYLIKWQKKY